MECLQNLASDLDQNTRERSQTKICMYVAYASRQYAPASDSSILRFLRVWPRRIFRITGTLEKQGHRQKQNCTISNYKVQELTVEHLTAYTYFPVG